MFRAKREPLANLNLNTLQRRSYVVYSSTVQSAPAFVTTTITELRVFFPDSENKENNYALNSTVEDGRYTRALSGYHNP